MNKLILAIAVAILALAMLACPVMATPKESSPAWYTIPVSQPSAAEISYEELTELCLDAGLSENPYPTPTTPTTVVNFPMYYVYGASEYREFTFKIGDEIYQGISYDPYDMTMNLVTGNGEIVFKATWYLGDIGQMDHGFVGTITVPFYGYGTEDYYYTGTMMLKGFGHFTGQTAELTVDTRENVPPAGYLTVLGNRIKQLIELDNSFILFSFFEFQLIKLPFLSKFYQITVYVVNFRDLLSGYFVLWITF